MPTLYLLCGVPGAGKTTVRNRLVAEINCHTDATGEPRQAIEACPDEHVAGLHALNGRGYPGNLAKAWAVTWQQYGQDLAARWGVLIWDSTMLTPVDRSPVINLALGFGWQVIAVPIEAPPEVCRARNAAREPWRRVPDEVMDRMIAAWTPPTLAEGFSGIMK